MKIKYIAFTTNWNKKSFSTKITKIKKKKKNYAK